MISLRLTVFATDLSKADKKKGRFRSDGVELRHQVDIPRIPGQIVSRMVPIRVVLLLTPRKYKNPPFIQSGPC